MHFLCVGKKILELLTTQYIMEKYPLLPANTCSTIVEAYIGQEGLADVGKSLGVQYVMRWKVFYLLDALIDE